jgi:hypothetical protein
MAKDPIVTPDPIPTATEASNSAATLLVMQKMLENMDNGRVQQVPLAKARIITPWNPTGKKNHERLRLTRNTYQNGARVVAERLTEEEIAAFNKLKPGRYGVDRKLVVIKRNDGSIELRYPNRSIEERMENGKLATAKDGTTGILGILEKVNDEYAVRLDKRKRGVVDEEDSLD